MADGPEAKIAKAFTAYVRSSAHVVSRYGDRVVLTEGLTQKYAFTSETLVLAAFSVKPSDKPSQVEDIAVDMYVCPVLNFEQSDTDSVLDVLNEFNEFRKILYAKPVLTEDLIGGSASVSLTRVIKSFEPRRITIPATAASLRIPEFVARYESTIVPKTGDFA